MLFALFRVIKEARCQHAGKAFWNQWSKSFQGQNSTRIVCKPSCCSYSVRCLSSKHQILSKDKEVLSTAPSISSLKYLTSNDAIDSKQLKQAAMGRLNEDDACFLLTLCGNQMVGESLAEKNKIAKYIFDSTEVKTIDLFNQLLIVFVENHFSFQSDEIQKILKKLELHPNKKTFSLLIAGHCLKGDITGAMNLTQQKSIGLLSEVYGYLTYGFCKAGLPEEGMKLFEQRIGNSCTWDTFKWLLYGLAELSSPVLFNQALDKYIFCFGRDVSITSTLPVFERLDKHGHLNEIKKLIQCMPVTEKDILYASAYMKSMPLNSSTFIFECLYHQFQSSLTDDSSVIECASVVLKNALQNGLDFENVMSLIFNFKQFQDDFQAVLYLALSLIMKEKPWYAKDFLFYLYQNNYKLNFPVPADLSNLIDLPTQLEESFHRLNSLYDDKKETQKIVSNLRTHLSQEKSPERSLASIFACNNGLADNCSLVLNSFILFFNVFGLEYWSLKKFQALLRKLYEADFRVSTSDFYYLNLMVDDHFGFLIDAITCYGDVHKQVNSIPPRPFNQAPELFKKDVINTCHVSEDSVKMPHVNGPLQAIYDGIVFLGKDTNFDNLNDFMRTRPIQQSFLHFLLCRYLESGKLNEANRLLSEYEAINLNIEVIPSSLLKMKNSNILSWLMQYMKNQYGDDDARWILYISYLKAGMKKNASNIVKNHPNMVLTAERCEQLLAALSNSDNFCDSLCTFVQQFFNSHKEIDIISPAIGILLQRGQLQEATKLLQICYGFHQELRKGTIVDQFLNHNQPIPGFILPVQFKALHDSIEKDSIIMKDVCFHLKDLASNVKHNSLSRRCVFALLSKIYTRLPANEFDAVTAQIRECLPSFRPHLQSAILLNQIEKLSEQSYDEALQFAFANLQQCSATNLDTWEKAICFLGNTALKQKNFNALLQLHDFSLSAMPKIQSITSSYISYWHLKADEGDASTYLKNNFQGSIPELLNVIVEQNDKQIFNRLLKISNRKLLSELKNFQDLLSCCILKGFELDIAESKIQMLPLSSLSGIAFNCYSSVDNCQQLQDVDTVFRRCTRSVSANAMLNIFLFHKFSTLYQTSYVDEKMIDFMTNKFFQVPARQNSLLARFVYIDLNTNVKFGSKSNKLCIYH